VYDGLPPGPGVTAMPAMPASASWRSPDASPVSALAKPDDTSSVFSLSPGFEKIRSCSRVGGGRGASTRTSDSDCADRTIRNSATAMIESDVVPATCRVCMT
jgi:hypothetical protein